MKWSARRASRVSYLIAKILYSGNFSAMVSPFRAARFDYAHVADSFARSAFGSASVVAAPGATKIRFHASENHDRDSTLRVSAPGRRRFRRRRVPAAAASQRG